MAQIIINIDNKKDIASGIILLQAILGMDAAAADTGKESVSSDGSVEGADTLLDMGDLVEADSSDGENLNDLLDGDDADLLEPEGVSVEDMKEAFKKFATAKGKDAAKAATLKLFGKLGVKGMGEIPDNKREAFVKALDTLTSK